MQVYVGTKVINAQPMSREDYCVFRGWDVPADEDGSDAGYLVEYVGETEANTPHFEGYVSWSPKAVFERAYVRIQSLPFGIALELLKQGYRVSRAGWNGKGQYLQMLSPSAPHVCDSAAEDELKESRPGMFNALFKVSDNNLYSPGTMRPWIGIHTVDNQFMPWVASQSDMLATDWNVVKPEAF